MNLLDDNRFSKITFFVLFITVAIISFHIVSRFILAILAGALLSQQLKPFHQYLVSKKINIKLSANLILLLVVVVVVAPLFFFIEGIIREASHFIQMVSSSNASYSSILEDLKKVPLLHHIIKNWTALDGQLQNLVKAITGIVSDLVIYLARQVPSLILDTIFILLSFVVFLLNGEKIKNFISNLIPLHDYIKKSLIISSNEISKKAFLASFVAAVGQAVTILIGFYTLNIPNAFLATGTTFLLSFIPFVGSAPVWIAAVIYLIFKGSVMKITLMVIIGIITSIVDNVIRAYILKSSKERLHPFIGLISVIGGIQAFGLLGVIVGPIFAALLISMCKVWPSVLEKKLSDK